jgi:integrase
MATKNKKRRRGRGEGAVFFSESKQCWIGRAIIGVLPDGTPERKEVSAKTKGEVLDKIKKAEEDARAGHTAEADHMTTGQYLQHWLDNVSKPSVSPTTWERYEQCVRLHLTPRIGGVRLDRLRPVHVEALFAKIQRDGISAGNAKKVSEDLSTALEHAARVGMISTGPAAPVPKPRREEEEIVPFTADEVLNIRLAAMGNRLDALFALAVSTGAREGELLALGWEHLDLDRGAMTAARTLGVIKGGFLVKEPKSKRGRRVVELPRFAVDVLLGHRKRALAEGTVAAATVFCTRTGGFISKSSFIRQVYKPLLVKAGVAYRKFHTFRHTHVSELLARGESVVEVARRVGDRPDVILKTYAHFLPDQGKKIASRLEEMYG